jgi:hypothetical protein
MVCDPPIAPHDAHISQPTSSAWPGTRGYLTIGLYPDGRPGEIFIKMAKEGSMISGMCQAFCRAFSWPCSTV